MKRLLCIVSCLNVGGAETFMMKLYRQLDKSRYQIDFVVSAVGVYDDEVRAIGGKIYRIPLRTKHPIKAFREIKRIVKQNQYAYVLKLGDRPLSVVDLIAAKMGGAKICAMRSCNALVGISFSKKVLDWILRPVLNRIATVKIAPSDLAARYTFGDKAYQNGEIAILHNAVDLNVFAYRHRDRVAIRTEFGLDEDALLIGHVGRFFPQKNHRFLIEVFGKISQKAPHARLMLVGTGDLEPEIRAQIADLGLTDRVIFTGVRSDVPSILSAMDVFVMPSFHEGMPNTVIEAQATGLPCVIADTITRGANITGLVTYLPLTAAAENWAEVVLGAVRDERPDTHQQFIENQYDIQSATAAFARLCFAE